MRTDIQKNYNTYQADLQRLREVNPYFAELIEDVRNHYPHSCRYRLSEGRAIIEAVLETGCARLIKEGPDVGRNPEMLWKLADHMKKNPDRIQSSFGLNGLGYFYRACYQMGFIGPEFDNYRIAIREHLRHRCTLGNFLNGEFEVSKNPYSIKYSRSPLPALVTIKKYRGAYLQDLTIRHFEMLRHKLTRTREDVTFIVNEVGVWMDRQGHRIDSVAEMTASRLQQAINQIRKKYKDKRRVDAMRYVFDIYQLAITENPDYPFFADSYLWSREMVFDFNVPMQLCRGYELVPIGSTSKFPPYKKVLFCFERRHRPFAGAHRFSVIACDFSSIKTDFYRSVIINYAAQNYGKGLSFRGWNREKRKQAIRTSDTSAKKRRRHFVHISSASLLLQKHGIAISEQQRWS